MHILDGDPGSDLFGLWSGVCGALFCDEAVFDNLSYVFFFAFMSRGWELG